MGENMLNLLRKSTKNHHFLQVSGKKSKSDQKNTRLAHSYD
jgi:hypothetical protein